MRSGKRIQDADEDRPWGAAGDPADPTADPPRVLSVSDLTEDIKQLVEGGFPSVWVAGEISNFSRPQSGHCYLTLKDAAAQIRAVIWRPVAARLRFDLHDGLGVVCRGSVDVYAPRGTYQLVISELQPLGLGALEQALRRLHDKLAAEGLFDPARKRALPLVPRRIAVVTSPTGAAIHDFLEVLRRRWQSAEVLVVPTRVQGDGAAQEIAAAIALANRLPAPADVLVVTRGGGSMEDLWAFNEEPVVRAIAASRIPTVSAVGHEIDITLADLVADCRALTPSEAAERVAPDRRDVLELLKMQRRRLPQALGGRIFQARSRLEALAQRRVLRCPQDLLYLRARLLDERAEVLARYGRQRLRTAGERHANLAARLESLSPLNVLARGYSLTQTTAGELVRDSQELTVGQILHTRLDRGEFWSRVERTAPHQALHAAERR